MTYQNKNLIRQKIEEEHWEIISPVCNLPMSWQIVCLLYENMNGQPCECLAQYIIEPASANWWKGMSDPVKGSRMVNLIAWKPKEENADRSYIVTEYCPHCENEIVMRWDTDTQGFQMFCPVCGKRLMLCDECRHAPDGGKCDFSAERDGCRRSKEHGNE